MLGDLDPAEAFALAKRYFEDIPPQPLPPRADVSEPPQTEERRGEVEEKFGPLPAIAIGYTAAAARHARLVRRGNSRSRAARRPRRPRLSQARARKADRRGCRRQRRHHSTPTAPRKWSRASFTSRNITTEATIAAFDEVIDEVQEKGISAEELDPVKVKFRSDYYSMLEGGMGSHMPRFGLMHYLACFTLVRRRSGSREYDSRRFSRRHARAGASRRPEISRPAQSRHCRAQPRQQGTELNGGAR